MRWTGLCALLVPLALLAGGCGSDDESSSATESTTTSTSSTVLETIDEDVPVGTDRHLLALRCYGTGSPTIILEAGTDDSGISAYAGMIRLLAERTRTTTCTYDRVGTGTSDPPAEARRTLDDVVSDLHRLGAAAGLATPYLLVGSSGGGNIALHYAGRYPRQVAGVVLLDVPGPNPELDKEFPGRLAWRNPEHIDWVDAERRQASLDPAPLGDIPLRIVTATRGQSSAQDQSVWRRLSSRARQTTLEGGHDLANENILGVVEEIQAALEAARS